MNVYPKAVEAFMSGGIDLLTDTIKVVLVDAGYVYSDTHEFLASVASTARVGTAVTLTGKAVTNGAFTADDPTFTAVTAGDTATGMVVYKDTGVEATSRLLAHIDRSGDSVPISKETNGGNILVDWPNNRIFKL